jgi:hypothetical protein
MPSDEDDMSIEELIAQITVDAYDDEAYWSFLQAFDDDLDYPLAATILGIPAQVTKVDFDGDERRGLTATVTRDCHTSTISLLDVELDYSETDARRLVAAYRHWLGIT